MNTKQERFSGGTLGLGVWSRVFCACLLAEGAAASARYWFTVGAVPAVLLALAAALVTGAACRGRWFCGGSAASRALCALAGVWFLWEGAQSLAQLTAVFQRDVLTAGALWCILTAAILCLRPLGAADLDRAGRILWWFVGIGLAALVLGLWTQLRWQRLSITAASPVPFNAQSALWLYPEYLTPALFFTEERRKDKAVQTKNAAAARNRGARAKAAETETGQENNAAHAAWTAAALPLTAWAVQAGFALCTELLFGTAGGAAFRGLELARAWGAGMFSRGDGVFLLVWAATAFFRIALMLCAARQLLRRTWKRREERIA